MKIGLFTDNYRPATNGVVYVIDIARRELEAKGHEVYIFCPAAGVRREDDWTDANDSHIIRIPSIQGLGYSEGQFALFYFNTVLQKVRDLELDIINFFSVGQVGLMAAYAARKTHTVLIGQHCTDVHDYIGSYPVLPEIVASVLFSVLTPIATNPSPADKKRIASHYKPKLQGARRWSKKIFRSTGSILYNTCDAAVAVSPKFHDKLIERAAADGIKLRNVRTIPTGVDALPEPSLVEMDSFRKQWRIDSGDEIVTYVGRLGKEKNLDMLIPTLERICEQRPDAKLMFVGDFDHREKLEELAARSLVHDRIIFTGRMSRKKLGAAYAATDVFVFPSLTDTQGLVLQEAAHAGLPIVLCDRDVNEVMRDGENGFVAANDPTDFADKVVTILSDKKLAKRFGKRSRELANKLSERGQTEKLNNLYDELLKRDIKN